MIYSSLSSIHSKDNDMAPVKPLAEKKPRYFSVDEANKALPLVRAIVGDIVCQYRLVEGLQHRVSRVLAERRRPSEDLYSEELAQTQSELETEEEKLRNYIEELKGLGVELKSEDGLCDFRCIMDGREVYLCWRLGEPEVMYWHELNAGYAGRQSLAAGSQSSSTDDRVC
jgi:hypothetical protein